MAAAAKVLGALLMIGGIFVLMAAFGPSREEGAMAIGAMTFSTGALTVALALYLQARKIKFGVPSAPPSGFAMTGKNGQPVKCGLCEKNPALLRCDTHQLAVCPSCLHQHDRPKWCTYAPIPLKEGVPELASAAR